MTQSRLDEQFEKMRAVLQKDGVDQSIIQKMINEIVKKRAEEPAPKIAIIGQSGVGKSSTINALFNAGLPVSPSRPCTHDADAREYSLSTGKKITVYDMPGIGESISADRRIIEVYKKVYPKVDVIMWVIAAGDRQLAMMQHILLQIAREAGARGLQQLLFAINKADIMSPNDWNTRIDMPSQEQLRNLRDFSETVRSRVREIIPAWTDDIPIYSAINAYNLKELLFSMLQAAPLSRAHILNENSNLEDGMKHVDPTVRDVAYQLFAENQEGVSYGEYK